jgi:large subunit ribosomal protein L23
MNEEQLMSILKKPHVTEKTAGQLVFSVSVDATKLQIKQAVEKMFEVTVESVRTVSIKGKRVRFGRIRGKRSDCKKAYIRLADGQEIDLFEN